ncbi:MAG: capsid protein [Desulfovibrionaceae bacterium]|nr:MAG: capsid protein [Desulfovibrionaceae bacterium]
MRKARRDAGGRAARAQPQPRLRQARASAPQDVGPSAIRKELAMDSFEQLWAMQPEAFTAFMRSTGEDSPQSRSPLDSEPDELSPYEFVSGVAVIPVEGVIMRRSFFSTGLKDISAALDAALAAPEVRAILFSIHSPGGQARGVKEVADAIFAARRVKPCAAWVDGLCASAAYWLASATGAVYAGPSAEVGSIGVILRHMDKSGWNKEMGLAFTYVTAGSYKAVGHPDGALSERDLGVLQARVDAIYEMFCGDVAQRMGLAPDNRAAWADGRDFLAGEAEALGLVTAIVPSRAEAIQKLLKETHMDKDELAKSHPDLLAAIQREAAEAALKERDKSEAQRAAQAKASALALMETVCGKETADKVRALMETGVTPEQLKAAAQVLGSAGASRQPSGDPKADMLEAIKRATPAAVNGGSEVSQDETAALIQRIGGM